MEFLGKVRDGSEGEMAEGYPVCNAVATDIESKKVILLYCEAYSFLAEGVKSEKSQLLKMIDTMFEHPGDRGMHTIDRGGDRGVLYKNYLGGEEAEAICDLAKALPTPDETV